MHTRLGEQASPLDHLFTCSPVHLGTWLPVPLRPCALDHLCDCVKLKTEAVM